MKTNLVPAIQFKNDLYEISKGLFLNKDFINYFFNIVTYSDKISEAFKNLFSKDNYLNVNEIDLKYDEEKKIWAYYAVKQIRSVTEDFSITWTVSELPIEEKIVALGSRFQVVCDSNPANEKLIEEIKKILEQCLYQEDQSNRFYVIGTDGQGGMSMKAEKIEDFKMDLELNYGKDFIKVHEKILNSLEHKNHGLVLCYGPPGTGKTSYIRHLIKTLCHKKDIVVIPTFLMNELSNPDFISFIRTMKNSILILEDAEEVLLDREIEGNRNQAISNILNITNGLLNDALQIQIIATFNMNKKSIDKALLRAGRLIEEWHFDNLTIEEANKLALHLGSGKIYTKPTPLADIYEGTIPDNDGEKIGKKAKRPQKKRVGFKDDEDSTEQSINAQ